MKNSWAEFYSDDYSLGYLIKNAACHEPMILSIYQAKPVRILEIGSGTGSLSAFLSYLGFKVVSVDNDKGVLKKATALTKKLNGRVKYLYADAFKLPFKDKSFDLVFHQGFFEHFSDEELDRLLAEQLRVGKVVVFSVPNDNYHKKDFGDERLLPKKYWDKLLGRYKIIESQNYNPERRGFFKNRLVYQVSDTMYFAKVSK